MIRYYTHNGQAVAVIGKSGSSAIGKAIHLFRKPHFKVLGSTPENIEKNWNGAGWQNLVSSEKNPTSPLIPVREPISRFRSACSQLKITDVDAALCELEVGGKLLSDFHFMPTSRWLAEGDNRLFKFPDHLPELSEDLGLDGIPPCNSAEGKGASKPDLSEEQQARVCEIYKDDIALFNSIENYGMLKTV